MYTSKQRFKIHELEHQNKKLFRLCYKEIVNNPKYINKLQKRIERFERNLTRDGKTVLNPMFDPLQLYLKFNRKKKSYNKEKLY